MKLAWIKLIPWNWQNRITTASKKIARVTAALEQGLGLRLLRTEIDEIFHPLQKEQTKNKNWDEFESFERWMIERRWRFYVPWRWHLIFQTARFVREVKKSIVFSLFWSQTTFFTDDLYYITVYSRIHVGTYGCSLLAFIPIDVDKLVSTMKNFERKPKKKPSNDNANAYKVFKPRVN